MDKPKSSAQDLSNLISNAESDIEKHATARRRRAKRGRYRSPSTILLGGLIVILAYCGHWLWVALRPPHQAQVAHDLALAVDQARAAVETAKTRTGELPDALPNASLAAVVRYEPERDEYRLVATMMGVRVTLQRDGTRSTDVGVSE